MRLMAWNPYFETGLAQVDAQHQALLDMINLAANEIKCKAVVVKAAQAIDGQVAGEGATFRMTLPMHRAGL